MYSKKEELYCNLYKNSFYLLVDAKKKQQGYPFIKKCIKTQTCYYNISVIIYYACPTKKCLNIGK